MDMTIVKDAIEVVSNRHPPVIEKKKPAERSLHYLYYLKIHHLKIYLHLCTTRTIKGVLHLNL
jgi:hypothetical protein